MTDHKSRNPSANPQRAPLTTTDLQTALGVASAATANLWADAYNQLASDPIRRNARNQRVLAPGQLEAIVAAHRLYVSGAVNTRSAAIQRVLASQQPGVTARTTPATEEITPTPSPGGSVVQHPNRQLELIAPPVGAPVIAYPTHVDSSAVQPSVPHDDQLPGALVGQRPPLPTQRAISMRHVFSRVAVALFLGFRFTHSQFWQQLPQPQRNRWYRALIFGCEVTIAIVSLGIVFLVVNGFLIRLAAPYFHVKPLPYESIVLTIMLAAYAFFVAIYLVFVVD